MGYSKSNEDANSWSSLSIPFMGYLSKLNPNDSKYDDSFNSLYGILLCFQTEGFEYSIDI